MHVWKEMYGYVSITVGCRWKFHSVLKIALYKYGNVENLWDSRKMKTTNVCMFLSTENAVCLWSGVKKNMQC